MHQRNDSSVHSHHSRFSALSTSRLDSPESTTSALQVCTDVRHHSSSIDDHVSRLAVTHSHLALPPCLLPLAWREYIVSPVMAASPPVSQGGEQPTDSQADLLRTAAVQDAAGEGIRGIPAKPRRCPSPLAPGLRQMCAMPFPLLLRPLGVRIDSTLFISEPGATFFTLAPIGSRTLDGPSSVDIRLSAAEPLTCQRRDRGGGGGGGQGEGRISRRTCCRGQAER